MTWTGPAIEDRVMRQPRLAVALLQILTQQTMELSGRIKAFAADSIQQRLARALLDFSERLGNREDDGGICMGPLSHELLSQYVGTSREVVTRYMNQFRRQGCLQYRARPSLFSTGPYSPG